MATCGEVMTSSPRFCVPKDSVRHAAQLMGSADAGAIPVVVDETTRRLIGIVTDRDLALNVVAQGLDAEATRVEQVMTRGVVTAHVDDDIGLALSRMEEHQVRRLPVVDERQRLLGIIAQGDLATRLKDRALTAELVEQVSRREAPPPRHGDELQTST